MEKNSIVKDSKSIHAFLLVRMEQLKLRPTDVIKDADKLGMKIESASLSKYLKHGNIKGALSEELIVWLATRWGIDVAMMVGTPKIVEGKLKIELPEYDEVRSLGRLKAIFG